MPGEITLLFRSNDQSPLGQIGDVAFVHNSTGVPNHRVLGSYALILLIRGQGSYADINHKPVSLVAGDAFILFPDIAHRYGPRRNGRWDEFYISFHGPVFDLWREAGVLTPSRLLFRLGENSDWVERLTGILDTPGLEGSERQIVLVSRLQAVLADLVTRNALPLESGAQLWLTEACHWLESELAVKMDCHWVAEKVGLSYDRFRKKFAEQTGLTPNQYRCEQRMRAARKMLTETDMTLKEIAASIGFYDEFAFSNRFKSSVGVSPRAFRRKVELDGRSE